MKTYRCNKCGREHKGHPIPIEHGTIPVKVAWIKDNRRSVKCKGKFVEV